MDNSLYVVHSSETEEQLNKFKVVLEKAGFTDITYILEKDYLQSLENKIIPNFTLCIQRTYRKVNSVYSNVIDVPIHEFFSKEYVNKDECLCLSGLPFSISEIFNDQYKRYAWNIICNLYKNYSSMVVNTDTEVIEEISTTEDVFVDNNAVVITVEDQKPLEEIIHKEPSVIEEPKDIHELDIKDNDNLFESNDVPSISIPVVSEIKEEQLELNLEQDDNTDYEFYKSFYEKYVKFISIFEELKSDVKEFNNGL